jgi:hypothetical protein
VEEVILLNLLLEVMDSLERVPVEQVVLMAVVVEELQQVVLLMVVLEAVQDLVAVEDVVLVTEATEVQVMQISTFYLLFPLMLACLGAKAEVEEVEQVEVVMLVRLLLGSLPSNLVWVMVQEVMEKLVLSGLEMPGVQVETAATVVEQQVFV